VGIGLNLVKHTLFINNASYGFTESWYRNTGAPPVFTVELAIMVLLAQARAKLLGTQGNVLYGRIQYTGNTRIGQTIPLNAGAGFPGSATDPSDSTFAAALCHFFGGTGSPLAADGRQMQRYLRGVWDTLIVKGGTFDPASPWIPLFAAYAAALVTNGFGWVNKNKTNSPPVTNLAAVTPVVQNANGTVTFTAAAEVGGDPPAVNAVPRNVPVQVRVSGVQTARTANGTFLVMTNDGIHFTTTKPLAVLPNGYGGKISYSVLQWEPVFSGTQFRVDSRKPGRPSFQSPGRQKVKPRG
jgi:hypothetical protein